MLIREALENIPDIRKDGRGLPTGQSASLADKRVSLCVDAELHCVFEWWWCVYERQRVESWEEDLDIGGDSCQPVFHRPDIPHTPVTLYIPTIHVRAHAASHLSDYNEHSGTADLMCLYVFVCIALVCTAFKFKKLWEN